MLSVQNFKAHRNYPSSLRKRLRSEVANGQRLDAQMEKLHPPLGRRRDVGDLPPMRGSERLLKIYNISAFPPCAPIYIYIVEIHAHWTIHAIVPLRAEHGKCGNGRETAGYCPGGIIMWGNVRYCVAAPYCVTSLNNVDADCAAAAWGGCGGEWTMANQLYVKSFQSSSSSSSRPSPSSTLSSSSSTRSGP